MIRLVFRLGFFGALGLLVLPLDGGGIDAASTVNAFYAAQGAVDDAMGLCGRRPDVCTAGSQAMHTIGLRAREGARYVYEALDARYGDAASEVTAAGHPVPAGDITGSVPTPSPRP